MKTIIKKEWEIFKDSFRLDRTFLYVLLLEVALIAILAGCYYLLTLKLSYLAPQVGNVIGSLSNDMTYSSPLALTLVKDDLMYVYYRVIAYIVVFAIFALTAWFTIKLFVYTTTNRKRPSKALLWRFTLLALASTIIFTLLFLLFEYLLGMVMFSAGNSFGGQAIIVLFTMIAILLLFFLTISFLTPVIRTKNMLDSIKTLWAVLKKLHLFGLPLMFQLLVFAVVNVVMFMFLLLPQKVALFLSGLLALSFFVWVRLYNTAVLDAILQKPVPVHKTITHHHNKKTVNKTSKKKK